ncbi:MAG: class B sortase [Ruminococcus sp.]|nr:class B sortase [Ruminococcus sp.]
MQDVKSIKDENTHSAPQNERPPTEKNEAAAVSEQPAQKTASDKNATNKIETIRSALDEISKKEEEAEIVTRITEHVRIYKDRKENPEKYAEEQKAAAAAAAAKRRRKRRRVPQKKQSLIKGVLPQRGDGVGEILRKSIFWLSSCVFVGCMIWMGTELYSRHQTQQKYDDIMSQYNSGSNSGSIGRVTTKPDTAATKPASGENASDAEPPTEETTYELLQGAANLLEMSDDVVGYIHIPDTVVNYPIMQNPEDDEGEEYFLHHDFYGNNSNLGSIFLDFRCNFDVVGEDKKLAKPNSDNLVIYGHNMLDESMFGSLRKYKDVEGYYEQHPLIEVNSNYESYVYKIYGYFIADATDTTDTRFEYWNYIDFTGENGFYEYVNEVKRRTLRLTDVDVKYGDQLLTLSTCSGVFDSARLVVCARRLREGEDPYAGTTGSTPNPNIKWPTIYYNWNGNTYDPDAEFVPYG